MGEGRADGGGLWSCLIANPGAPPAAPSVLRPPYTAQPSLGSLPCPLATRSEPQRDRKQRQQVRTACRRRRTRTRSRARRSSRASAMGLSRPQYRPSSSTSSRHRDSRRNREPRPRGLGRWGAGGRGEGQVSPSPRPPRGPRGSLLPVGLAGGRKEGKAGTMALLVRTGSLGSLHSPHGVWRSPHPCSGLWGDVEGWPGAGAALGTHLG